MYIPWKSEMLANALQESGHRVKRIFHSVHSTF